MKRISVAATTMVIALLTTNFVPATNAATKGGIHATADRTLANGLRIVAVRNTLSPVVATWMNYRVGSDDDGALPGLAHASEHMMFRGSTTVTESQFADSMAIMGGDFNGSTGAEMSSYYFEVPAQDLDAAMRLEASRCGGLVDDPRLWERERGAIRQEVAMRNSTATYRLTAKVQASVLEGTPYGNEGLGTDTVFATLSDQKLRAFHARYYRPNNAVYVVVGDIDPDAVVAHAEAIFGSIPAGTTVIHDAPPQTATSEHSFEDDASASPSDYLILGWRLPGYQSEDYEAAQVLFRIFADDGGPLKSFRDHDVSRTQAALRGFPRASIGFVGASIRIGADVRRTSDVFEEKVDRLRLAGVSESQVLAAKSRLETEAELESTSVSGEARTLSESLVVRGRTPEEIRERIARVTVADVNRVFKRALTPASRREGVARANTTGARSTEANGGADHLVQNLPTTHDPLPSYVQALVADLKVPTPSTVVRHFVLSNGIRLDVATNKSSHAVVVRGAVLGIPEVPVPSGKDGVDRVIEQIFSSSGEDARADVADEADYLGADPRVGPAFGIEVKSRDFRRAMKLLARVQTKQAFDDGSVRGAIARILEEIAARAHSPQARAAQALCVSVYGDADERCAEPTATSVSALSTSDVIERYAETYRPDRTTIVVVGNVEPEVAKDAIERSFGAWRAAPRPPEMIVGRARPNPAGHVVNIDVPGARQTNVTLAQALDVRRTDSDYVALRVANALLTGGLFGSYLYEDLRQERGLVYSVASQIDTGTRDALFTLRFGSAPSGAAVAADLVKTRILTMQSKVVSQDRLTRTKALLMSDLPLSMDSYGGFAQRILFYAKDGLPPDQAFNEARRVLETTPEEVLAVVRRHINVDAFSQVVVGPPNVTPAHVGLKP